ncbi:hypothetical protein PSTG_19125 [Puccinia striiformis f. sp. tritici PST-78]|uniref:Uncharacterized protein n=1 Tax=Puccinia striiformis f. sp. tritici PST-78 TaxID=1165861 RepID=A0A0L0UKM0_9BASI|nr:hypothetical protein PSTG_19125 [Puccinia striiformis f. sp. tritici PST-78]
MALYPGSSSLLSHHFFHISGVSLENRTSKPDYYYSWTRDTSMFVNFVPRTWAVKLTNTHEKKCDTIPHREQSFEGDRVAIPTDARSQAFGSNQANDFGHPDSTTFISQFSRWSRGAQVLRQWFGFHRTLG